jgi:putative transposase
LRDRYWICPVCKTEHDRDVNASKNLLKYGIAHLTSSRAGTVQTKACGEAKSLVEAGSLSIY